MSRRQNFPRFVFCSIVWSTWAEQTSCEQLSTSCWPHKEWSNCIVWQQHAGGCRDEDHPRWATKRIHVSSMSRSDKWDLSFGAKIFYSETDRKQVGGIAVTDLFYWIQSIDIQYFISYSSCIVERARARAWVFVWPGLARHLWKSFALDVHTKQAWKLIDPQPRTPSVDFPAYSVSTVSVCVCLGLSVNLNRDGLQQATNSRIHSLSHANHMLQC